MMAKSPRFNPLMNWEEMLKEAGKVSYSLPKSLDISITDIIDDFWGYGPTALAKDLKEAGKVDELNITINSPGGSAFDGIAIYNILKQHPARVNVNIIALAASAASIIAMAGDSITMGEGALMMIHNASGIVVGTASDMRDFADLLTKLDGELVKIYARRTGKDEKQIAKWMADETWMTGEEAVESGFASSFIGDDGEEEIAAALAPEKMKVFAYRHPPEKIAAYFAANNSKRKPAREPQFEPAPEPIEEAEEMDLAKLTIEELRAGRPELVSEIETAASNKAGETATTDAIKRERERCAAIADRSGALAGRYPKCAVGIQRRSKTEIETGAAPEAAEAAMKEIVLTEMEKETPPDIGANADPDNHTRKPAADTPEGWKAEYQASSALQDEFGAESIYIAFMRAKKAGNVAILGQK